MSEVVHPVDLLLRKVGAYLALLFGVYILYIFCRPQRQLVSPIPSAPAATPLLVMSLLLSLTIVNCDTSSNHLKLHTSARETTQEIEMLQNKMVEHVCNYWDLSKDYSVWMHEEGNYAVSLACALARLKINCPCDSSDEYVPVVRENQLRCVDNFQNTDCPTTDKRELFGQKLELVETTSEFLCSKSHLDSWSREHYGQLIASACILSKKAYNCHCHGPLPHKHIFRDLLTIRATNANMTTRFEQCAKVERQLFSNREREETTLYAEFYGKRQ